MTEPERPQAETASDMPQHASPSGEAPPSGEGPPSGEASPSGQAEGETVQTVKEAAFEPVPQAASAPPEAQSATGTSRRDAMPEAAARPRPPARQAGAAPTPWLPPALSALLPRLTLAVVLLAIPIAAAAALQIWLARTHAAYDESLLLADGGADEVTALQWSPTDGVLYVGTRSGNARKILADGTVAEVLSSRDVDPTDGAAMSPVQSFHSLQSAFPVVVYQSRLDPTADRPADAFAATPISPGMFGIEGGLFAAVEANNGTAVVGRSRAAGSEQQVELPDNQQFELPANNAFNAKQAAPDPRVQQQIQQQLVQEPPVQKQQTQPTGEQLKGESIPPQQVPVDPGIVPSGSARFSVSLFRDLQSGSVTLVSAQLGIEDVRAVAALPGTNTVIAGDGAGNVFAIDASQQISGASPETYIRGIGQHETAIVEIAVAAEPGERGVLFATRAEDSTIKVWRGSVGRASQLIALGDYPNADVTTPGSTWVREPASFADRRSRTTDVSLTALLGMSADGRRILARRANTELVLLDLPAQGEDGTATEHRDVYYVAADSPAALSPDGTRLLAPDITNDTIGLVDLSDAPNGQASQYAVASFRGLAGTQFRRFAFDGTGRRFIAVATSGSIYVQNIETPDRAITLGQYQGPDIEAAISPDGSLVAVADASGRITVHSAEDGSELTRFDGPQNIARLTFDSAAKHLRAVGDDRGSAGGATIFTYSLRNSRSTTYIAGFHPDQSGDGFTPSGDRYFMRDGDAGYSIVDIDSGAEVGKLLSATGATGWVSSLDGSRIATLGGRGNISLFREEESPTASGPMPVMADNALRLSADGGTLAVGGRGGELYVARLDGDAGEAGYRLRRLTLPAPALQYDISPDGASIVTAEADGTVSISDLSYTPSAVPADRAATGGAQPTPAADVTVADAVEISGHGAPLTAIALSPDGERLATASLDGRLRVTSVAWARLVRRLPLAALPSGPERTKLEPQPLDESPYALMSGGFGANSSTDRPDAPLSGEPFIIVYNARKSLSQAQGARDRAAQTGFANGQIYRRQGFFRGVFAFATAEERDAALPDVQKVFGGAYARDLRSWCPNPRPAPDGEYIDCEAVLAGTAPPAAAN